MELAFGVLGWTPQVFWSATLAEFFAACDGWTEANSPPEKQDVGAPSRERVEEMKRRYG